MIKKAIIPIAGKGTRFLPATKEIAKEIIPIINVPMIHYVVAEAAQAGIEQIIFITSSGKDEVLDYFDRNIGLEDFLIKNNKLALAEKIKSIGQQIEVISIRQKEQLGLGHAILCAQPVITEGESFAVLLGDDIILSDKPVTKQLIDAHHKYNKSQIIGMMEIPKEDTSKYGILKGNFIDDKNFKMEGMIEKPKPQDAPSCFATPGRYILNYEIFDVLKKIPRGAGGEYQLTDAINLMCAQDTTYGHLFDGERFDTGNIHGYLDATLEFALRDSELNPYMFGLLKEKLKKYQ